MKCTNQSQSSLCGYRPVRLNSLPHSWFKVDHGLKIALQYCCFLSSALQVAGDCCGFGPSLPGQRKLPWAVLLHREASEVLSDWSYSGGEISSAGRRLLTKPNVPCKHNNVALLLYCCVSAHRGRFTLYKLTLSVCCWCRSDRGVGGVICPVFGMSAVTYQLNMPHCIVLTPSNPIQTCCSIALCRYSCAKWAHACTDACTCMKKKRRSGDPVQTRGTLEIGDQAATSKAQNGAHSENRR